MSEKAKPEKKFLITLSMGNDNEPGTTFIGANGRDFNIKRGKEVAVPQAVLDVLDNAVLGVAEPDPSDPNKTVIVDRKRFPYTVHGVAE